MFLFRKKIINFARKVKEGPDPLFYNKPQKYFVNFETRIKNKSKASLSLFLIMPVPQNTYYQKLLKEPKFSPAEPILNKDEIFGNKYGYWNLRVLQKQQVNIKEEFVIEVSPRKNSAGIGLKNPKNLMRPNLINCFVDPHNKKVQEAAKKIADMNGDLDTILKKINDYVVSSLSYGNPITGLYSSEDSLVKKKVDCGGFDTLYAALCIAAGIPARIISGFFAGYNNNSMHAWLEIRMPDGTWIPADPSIEHLRNMGRTKKSGELGFVGSDRIALSVGCEIPVKLGEKFLCVDILQNPIIISGNNETFKIETKFETKFL